MTTCPLHRRIVAVLVTAGGMLLPVSALAADASLPYRNQPGFHCNRWNNRNECTDWSYYEQGRTAPPSYGGTSSIPLRRSFPVLQCGNANTDCTGPVTVRVRATPNPVPRGDTLTYTIYVRNDDSQIRSVSVRAFLDSAVGFDRATYGGYSDGDIVRWDNFRMPARSSRTFVLRTRVRSDASTANPIQLRVQTDKSVDSVLVNVQDNDYYGNSLRILDDGVYVRYNRYSGNTRMIDRPVYYYDSRSRLIRRYDDSYYNNLYDNNYYYDYDNSYYYNQSSPGYSCDPSRYICR